MPNTSNSITISIGGRTPREFLLDLHHAISEAKMLIFERRGLDLDENQSYALFILSDLQQKIVTEGRNT